MFVFGFTVFIDILKFLQNEKMPLILFSKAISKDPRPKDGALI